ncbi:methoxyneurosporene dehydrogenase [Marinibacterium profundimaris]|uniref:Methoxyneurosporene dehydrogenase n=1 Tax=Marinibacterium profundimaris TaxID=1679460 RepID=A0A225NMY6_9RHOB|nr:methoxyneurosporene dehydrogenase [Marinibacterium profundimaris]
MVGAGIAGLAAAARLAHAGLPVTVLERHDHVGGKLRALPSVAGPVDAGPTVLTLRPVFEALFDAIGERLNDHVTLTRQPLLARHFWPDGSRLDLTDDEATNAGAIRAFSGDRAARDYLAFSARARALFAAFDGPMMQAPAPRLSRLAGALLRRPLLVHQMAPFSTLAGMLGQSFSDPRLAQLFGRYATYVGGSPYESPALLSLIWQAEAAGVWTVEGGLHRLAQALARIAGARGACIRLGAHVDRIETEHGVVTGVTLADGTHIAADMIVFNGDPRALTCGALGPGCRPVAPGVMAEARALSADVWAFAARARGPELTHHNVFFRDDPKPEFDSLARGRRSPSPTLYICAQDRGHNQAPPDVERFEIIANAPPLAPAAPETDTETEARPCPTETFDTLARFGLTFDPLPPTSCLTTPAEFDRLFPHSLGSLYGQSPHGMMAAFRRPTARTAIRGLYLAGGGTHPGAGLPMATLSARHAAEAILDDRTSTSRSRRTDTPGGMSTGSAPTTGAPSASSGS